jgi:hypothetical protein
VKSSRLLSEAKIAELNELIGAAERLCHTRGIHADDGGVFADQTWAIRAARRDGRWRLSIECHGEGVFLVLWPDYGGPGQVLIDEPGWWRDELLGMWLNDA